MIRPHRVRAFVAWAGQEPAEGPPLPLRPGARFFRDLTRAEIQAAAAELRGMAVHDLAEADRIEREHFGGDAA
jgi:hypothetical protein